MPYRLVLSPDTLLAVLGDDYWLPCSAVVRALRDAGPAAFASTAEQRAYLAAKPRRQYQVVWLALARLAKKGQVATSPYHGGRRYRRKGLQVQP
jgi:hypothetical protein